jgi:hypothetical protein
MVSSPYFFSHNSDIELYTIEVYAGDRDDFYRLIELYKNICPESTTVTLLKHLVCCVIWKRSDIVAIYYSSSVYGLVT